MRCVCIVFRYSNEYDTNWKLKRLVNQVWWNMFISFTSWNHWQHCMNNKLNTFTKWYVWLFYLLFILSHINRSIYVALSGKMAQNAFFGENELLSFSCTLLSLEHTNSIFFKTDNFWPKSSYFWETTEDVKSPTFFSKNVKKNSCI